MLVLLTATAGISAPVRCPTAQKFVCCDDNKKLQCKSPKKFVSNASECNNGECCYCPDDAKTTCNIDEYKKWDAGNCACVCVEEEPTDVNGNGICGGDLEWDSENCQCSCPDSATKEQECIKKAYATWDHTLCACECTQPSEPAPTGKVWSDNACDYVLSCDPDGSKQQACDQKNEGKELDDPIWALDEQCQMYCQGFCADYEELDEINCVCHPISTVFEESTISNPEESTVTDITPEVTVSPLESTTTTTPSLEGSLSITPEVTVSGSEEEVTGSDSITTTTPDVSGSPLSTTTAPEGSGFESTPPVSGSNLMPNNETTQIATKGCYWTDWRDSGKPEYAKTSGDEESIVGICSGGHVESIQCRAEVFPDTPFEELGQVLQCNTEVGLICKNEDQKPGAATPVPVCLNYEIRAYCCA